MSKNILKIIAVILLGFLQLTLMPVLNIKGIFPNLILVGVITLVLLDFEMDAFFLAGFGGLILDLGSPLFFGFNTLFFILIVFLISFLMRRFLPQVNILILLLVIFLGSIIYGVLSTLFLKEQVSINIIFESLLAAVLGFIFSRILFAFNKSSQVIKIASL